MLLPQLKVRHPTFSVLPISSVAAPLPAKRKHILSLSEANEYSEDVKLSNDLRPKFMESKLLVSKSEKPESRLGFGPSSKLSVYEGKMLSTLDLPELTKDMSVSGFEISYGDGSDNNLEFPESSAAVEINSGLAHAILEEKVKNPTKLLRNTNSLN
nr:hypothetical protein Iba_chr08bCG4340 [Ipomoea batatas]GMD26520.1 hypothetical protein Iba_chr08dCG5060 [Ipomoea batatas]